MNRRTFLLSGLSTGALLVGCGTLPARGRLGDPGLMPVTEGEAALNGWIKIAADGSVALAMPYSEMGQGVHTGLAMLVAEELDLPLARVRPIDAGHDAIYTNTALFVAQSFWFHPRDAGSMLVDATHWLGKKAGSVLGVRATGGSRSIVDAWEPLRLAAATARAQLLGAAARQWGVSVEDLTIHEGIVRHASGKTAHFGALARAAAATSPARVQLKSPAQWRLIGRSAPRLDVAAKCDGSARFGIDVRLPGMVYAALRFAPALGGRPGAVDPAPALALPGVLRVVRVPPFGGADEAIAVVGRTWWHAKRGADALDLRSDAAHTEHDTEALDSTAILDDLEREARAAAANERGFPFHVRGDAAAAFDNAARTIEAVYRAPYLAHAALEPPNCTARVTHGQVEVWAPTQVPSLARALAARVAGVPEEAVTLHVTYLGGGFGRRAEIDVVGQAVHLALHLALDTDGAPVQLIWPREEDFAHDFYRPAAAAVLRAAVDARGRLSGFAATSASDAIQPRSLARLGHVLAKPVDWMWPDRTTVEGLFDLPYAIENQRIAHVATEHRVPVGYWRSVGHSHNAFFSESFIDELAHATRRDPVAFRLELLHDMPRHAAVLRLAAEKAGWGKALPAGHAHGVALHESFGSIVAQVAEVSLAGGVPRVQRVVCAIDCGVAINPDLIAQQMESGIVFGLSAALHGRIDIEGGIVKQRNFPDFPLVMLATAPRIETHIVPSARPPSGVGEPGVPPIAPAVSNALFVLTGQRLRELPLAMHFQGAAADPE